MCTEPCSAISEYSAGGVGRRQRRSGQPRGIEEIGRERGFHRGGSGVPNVRGGVVAGNTHSSAACVRRRQSHGRNSAFVDDFVWLYLYAARP